MVRERILWTKLGRITLLLLHILLAVKIAHGFRKQRGHWEARNSVSRG